MSTDAVWHGTTILHVRKGGRIAIGGDGQVTLGQTATFRGLAEKYVKLDESTRAKPNTDHKELYAELLTRQGDLTRRLHAADYL